MVCATPVQDISTGWFDMMSVCIISLRQGISIWNQHVVISVWYDVISVAHDIWISYVSHHDIEDNKWCDMYHQKGTPITSCWHDIILICHISYSIQSHHHITSSHPIPPHHTALHITSHHPIPSHNEIIPSLNIITSPWHDIILICHIISYHVIITSHLITSCHAIPSIT